MLFVFVFVVFFFKQKTAYEMRISDWSSDVCSSDLPHRRLDDRAIAIDREHALDIGAVDLDEIDGEGLKIGKGGRASAEIVEADSMSIASKLLQHGLGPRELVDLTGLSYLEHQLLADRVAPIEHRSQRCHEAVAAKGAGRPVHRALGQWIPLFAF